MKTIKKLMVLLLLMGLHQKTLTMNDRNIIRLATLYTYNHIFNAVGKPFLDLGVKKLEQTILRPNFVSEVIKPSQNTAKSLIEDQRNKQLLDDWVAHGRLVQSHTGKKACLTHRNALFIGKSGTGKTEFAKQLGHKLDLPVTIVNGAELAGKYSEPLAVRSFLQKTKGIIYINEADFLLKDRDLGTKEQQAIFTTVLSALNTPNDKQIFIVDTNMTKELDPGMIRRFPAQVHFENPTQEMREQIIQLYVENKLKPLGENKKSLLTTEQSDQLKESLSELLSQDAIKEIAHQTDGACGAHLEDFVSSLESKVLINKGNLTKEMIDQSFLQTQQVIKRSMK